MYCTVQYIKGSVQTATSADFLTDQSPVPYHNGRLIYTPKEPENSLLEQKLPNGEDELIIVAKAWLALIEENRLLQEQNGNLLVKNNDLIAKIASMETKFVELTMKEGKYQNKIEIFLTALEEALKYCEKERENYFQ